MRTALLAPAVILAAGNTQAQSPTAKLPSQAELPTSPSTPNAGTDEVAPRRKLEDQGCRDPRNVTPNDDGSFSERAVRQNPPGTRPGINREVDVEIDALGNIKER